MTNLHLQCPVCGTPIQPGPPQNDALPASCSPAPQEERERDHRGILLPRRTRIGGIIMPTPPLIRRHNIHWKS